MSERSATRSPFASGLVRTGSSSPRTRSAGSVAKPLLLCLSHLRWNFVWQRPQHLLSRAAREFRVVFWEEPDFRPDVLPHLETTEHPGGIRVALPVLPASIAPAAAVVGQRELLDGFLRGEASDPAVLWYYTPMAMDFSGHVEADVCVYDNMDELSAFRGASPEMLANEDDLFARADLVFTGGLSLFEAKRERHSSVHAFPSSIDVEHFLRARRTGAADPIDQAGIPRPRIGFFGVIDERMDIDLLDRVARARPDWRFVMIGPVVKIDPSTLPRHSNIHWLGPKSYAELPAYLAGWDVGFMPFALNESTRFISPTKTPEFLAAGLPLVSTAITDVVRPYGQAALVEIAQDADDMVAKLGALLGGTKTEWLERVDRQLATGSWDRVWADMRRLIGEAGGPPVVSPTASTIAGASTLPPAAE